MLHRRLSAILIAGSTGLAAACGSGGGYSSNSSTPTSPNGTPTPAANTVVATASITFDPGTLTVTRGTTVTFSFQSVGHNVFFDSKTGAPADIPNVLSNTSVTRTFEVTGSFGFECHVHPGMRGTVVVQ